MEFQSNVAYAALAVAIMLSALTLGFCWRQQWLRDRATLRMLAFGVIPLALWDAIAAHVGQWTFSSTYTLGIGLLGLPVEEYGFLLAMSLVSLAVFQRFARNQNSTFISIWWLLLPMFGAVALNIAFWGQGYAALVSVITLTVVTLLVALARPLLHYAWLRYQLVMLAIFAGSMTVLSKLSIVGYSMQGLSGVHLGVIPIEQFLYIFAFINVVIVAYYGRTK